MRNDEGFGLIKGAPRRASRQTMLKHKPCERVIDIDNMTPTKITTSLTIIGKHRSQHHESHAQHTNAHGRPTPENLPIANLDDLQPVHAPHNKIFPIEVSNGSPDKPPHEHIPADADVEKAVVTEEEQERKSASIQSSGLRT